MTTATKTQAIEVGSHVTGLGRETRGRKPSLYRVIRMGDLLGCGIPVAELVRVRRRDLKMVNVMHKNRTMFVSCLTLE